MSELKKAIRWFEDTLSEGRCGPECEQCNAYETALVVLRRTLPENKPDVTDINIGNKPLTLEELRQMDGEAVTVPESKLFYGGTGAVDVEREKVWADDSGWWDFDEYGEWLAYRRKPERSEG